MGRNKGSKERGRVWMEGGGEGDVTGRRKGSGGFEGEDGGGGRGGFISAQ